MTTTDYPGREGDALERFHPLVAAWFREHVGTPTDIQQLAWPAIAGDDHVLLVAPTGTGKTLAAFLWGLDCLISGRWPHGTASLLYISPLKALNADIRENLVAPLRRLQRRFRDAGQPFPEIRVLTRSGDTPAADRRRMLRNPPEILITTPESLNILLATPPGRATLQHLRAVILDEIHAVVDSKRGTHLVTALERLVGLAGEFRRIALSATVAPAETVAEFVGGFRREGEHCVARPVRILRAPGSKRHALRIRAIPRGDAPDPEAGHSALSREVAESVAGNRATLVFTRTRSRAEELARRLNAAAENPVVYAHHGALSREVRHEVERRMRAGELRAVVATNSLELGIDVGSIDEVVLVQPPSRVAAALQRVGRAGHRVGAVSRGTLVPLNARDLLESAVLVDAMHHGALEPVRPVEAPLDVLAQVIVGAVVPETRPVDELYAEIRRAYPYRDLPRRHFDLVLDMLAGRYAGTRIRELKPRVIVDAEAGTVRAAPGTATVLFLSGGTIPDRGYFTMRDAASGAVLGELDEEFVWETAVGRCLSLGTRAWRIDRITRNDVFVRPAGPDAAAPFWRGEAEDRDFGLSERIGTFLEEADPRVDDPDFAREVAERFFLDPAGADDLLARLRRQREATGCPLPHRHHVVLEHVATGPGGVPGASQLILHTLWGGRVNRPLAMALAAVWAERFGDAPEYHAGDDGICLLTERDVSAAELLAGVTPERIDGLLRRSLEGSGFFGARFRECAGRALLLPRTGFRRRMPLWMTRLRSAKLLQAVSRLPDFPILLEAWRTCIRDSFDLDSLRRMLDELEAGQIAVTEVSLAAPSPFAEGDSWRRVNDYMYRDDTPNRAGTSALSEDLLREAVFSPSVRPELGAELVREFEAKRRRTAPGYAPRNAAELYEWVRERLLIPREEWSDLLRCCARDGECDPGELERETAPRLVCIRPNGFVGQAPVAAAEDAPVIIAALYRGAAKAEACPAGAASPARLRTSRTEVPDASDLAGRWLSFCGPFPDSTLTDALGVPPDIRTECLAELASSGRLAAEVAVAGDSRELLCDAENLEILLRMKRRSGRLAFEPLPPAAVQVFLAMWQGLCRLDGDNPHPADVAEQLEALPLPAALWETEVMPARVAPYDPGELDSALRESRLVWSGCGRTTIAFGFPEERWALPPAPAAKSGHVLRDALTALFPDPAGRYPMSALLRRTPAATPEETADMLWQAAWKGLATTDSFAPVRAAIARDFRFAAEGAPPPPPHPDIPRRPRFRNRPRRTHHRTVLPEGNWLLVDPAPFTPDDPLEELERAKDRARILLDRYGVLFRELTEHEAPAYRWSSVFRALRILELAGEVVSGRFFEEIPGLQFAPPEAVNLLRRGVFPDTPWSLSAADPASLAGISLPELRRGLPRRLPGNHVSWRGSRILLVSERNGARLDVRVPPDDTEPAQVFAPLIHLLHRPVMPLRCIRVDTINGVPACRSPYRPHLSDLFDAAPDGKRLTLFRRVRPPHP